MYYIIVNTNKSYKLNIKKVVNIKDELAVCKIHSKLFIEQES